MGNILTKIILATIAIIGVVGVLVYLVVFSPQLANKDQFITLRYNYGDYVKSARRLLKLPVTDHSGIIGTPIQVLVNLGDGSGYRYSMQGRLEAIDSEGSLMTLLCSNGKRYTFVVELKPATEQGKVEIVGTSDEGAGRRKNKWVLSTSDGQYDQSHIYDMVWEDSRTLAQILFEHKQNPSEAINKNAGDRAEVSRY